MAIADSGAKHPGGVPPTLTTAIEQKLCALISTGTDAVERFGRLCHRNPRTVHDWYSLGGEPGAAEHWREFRRSVDWARLEHAQAVAGRLRELRDVELRPESVRIRR